LFRCFFPAGEAPQGPRREFFNFTDNADPHALRYGGWKISFKTMGQPVHRTLKVEHVLRALQPRSSGGP
jgi:hypothetical protein